MLMTKIIMLAVTINHSVFLRRFYTPGYLGNLTNISLPGCTGTINTTKHWTTCT